MGGREKILVRGVNWLGDAVMSTPALLRLREARPAAHIALLTPAKLADLWLCHPAVDQVIEFAEKDGVLGVARKLRPHSFSTALLFPNSHRSALEAYLAGIPHRIGLALPWRNIFLTQRVLPRTGVVTMRKRTVAEIQKLALGRCGTVPTRFIPESSHQVFHYLHLTGSMGARNELVPPRIEITAAEVLAIKQRFTVAGDSARPLLGLNAGAEYGPAKRWPRERFVAAAIELQRRTNCRWWILGGQGDAPLASEILAAVRAANIGSSASVQSLAGQTSLRELGAALKACDAVLTNDTGPMHLAAAVGTKVVVPFGSTSPELTGPGLPGDARHHIVRGQAPCAPCFQRECPIDFRCMTSIAAEEVVSSMMKAMGKV